MGKLKPLLPTLREKKRYLVFEVISKKKITVLKKAAKAVAFAYGRLHGEHGIAESGLMFVQEKSDGTKGMMRVNRKYVDNLKAALALVDEVDGDEALIRSVGVSGSLKKAQERFIAS